MAASETSICNRALQKVGASRIVSLGEDSKNARECAAAYPEVRDAELRAHPWSFAVKRAALPATNEEFEDGSTAFTVPSDFLRLLPGRLDRDLQIEGRRILSRVKEAPLRIRYVARITDATLFDPLFVEALAASVAMEINERMTQSNTKMGILIRQHDRALDKARRANALERPPAKPQTDPWIEARRIGPFSEWADFV